MEKSLSLLLGLILVIGIFAVSPIVLADSDDDNSGSNSGSDDDDNSVDVDVRLEVGDDDSDDDDDVDDDSDDDSDDDGDDDAEDDNGNIKEEDEEDDETYVPIMKIHPADHVFPLSFVPKSRTSENELQHVVLVPAPLELHKDLKNICVKGVHKMCACVSCGRHEGMLGTREFIGDVVHHERDFLR